MGAIFLFMMANVATSAVTDVSSMSTENMEQHVRQAMKGLSRSVRYPSIDALAKEHDKEHGPMSLERALATVKNLPSSVMAMLQTDQHKVSKHAGSLVQDAGKKKKGIEEALDKVKLTLANMMLETQTEMDEAILLCTETDAEITGILDQNQADRADLGSAVATAKSEIAQASATLEQCSVQLANIKRDSTAAAEQCAVSMATQRAGLKILEEDLQISLKVQNMTDCPDIGSTSLLQCDHGSGGALRYKFAGKAAAYDGFKSKAAVLAVQRTAKSILKKPGGTVSLSAVTILNPPSTTIRFT